MRSTALGWLQGPWLVILTMDTVTILSNEYQHLALCHIYSVEPLGLDQAHRNKNYQRTADKPVLSQWITSQNALTVHSPPIKPGGWRGEVWWESVGGLTGNSFFLIGNFGQISRIGIYRMDFYLPQSTVLLISTGNCSCSDVLKRNWNKVACRTRGLVVVLLVEL